MCKHAILHNAVSNNTFLINLFGNHTVNTKTTMTEIRTFDFQKQTETQAEIKGEDTQRVNTKKGKRAQTLRFAEEFEGVFDYNFTLDATYCAIP